MHKELLRAFFKSAIEMVGEGEVHVTHRDDYPYNTWEVEKLAEEAGFGLKERVGFEKWEYPGYHNKRGGDINCNKTFPLKDSAFTFKFSLINKNNDVDLVQKNEISDTAVRGHDMAGLVADVECLQVSANKN